MTDPRTLEQTGNVGHDTILFCAARVPHSERLFVGSSDFNVYEVDLAADKPEFRALEGQGHQSYVTGAALAGNRLITGAYDGRLIWWDTENRVPTRSIEAHDRWIRRVVAG